MEILDQKDLGSGGSAEAASAATIRTKLDARLQLETVSRMHTFVQANPAGGLSFEFTPAYQTMAQDLREALLTKTSSFVETHEVRTVLYKV